MLETAADCADLPIIRDGDSVTVKVLKPGESVSGTYMTVFDVDVEDKDEMYFMLTRLFVRIEGGIPIKIEFKDDDCDCDGDCDCEECNCDGDCDCGSDGNDLNIDIDFDALKWTLYEFDDKDGDKTEVFVAFDTEVEDESDDLNITLFSIVRRNDEPEGKLRIFKDDGWQEIGTVSFTDEDEFEFQALEEFGGITGFSMPFTATSIAASSGATYKISQEALDVMRKGKIKLDEAAAMEIYNHAASYVGILFDLDRTSSNQYFSYSDCLFLGIYDGIRSFWDPFDMLSFFNEDQKSEKFLYLTGQMFGRIYLIKAFDDIANMRSKPQFDWPKYPINWTNVGAETFYYGAFEEDKATSDSMTAYLQPFSEKISSDANSIFRYCEIMATVCSQVVRDYENYYPLFGDALMNLWSVVPFKDNSHLSEVKRHGTIQDYFDNLWYMGYGMKESGIDFIDGIIMLPFSIGEILSAVYEVSYEVTDTVVLIMSEMAKEGKTAEEIDNAVKEEIVKMFKEVFPDDITDAVFLAIFGDLLYFYENFSWEELGYYSNFEAYTLGRALGNYLIKLALAGVSIKTAGDSGTKTVASIKKTSSGMVAKIRAWKVKWRTPGGWGRAYYLGKGKNPQLSAKALFEKNKLIDQYGKNNIKGNIAVAEIDIPNVSAELKAYSGTKIQPEGFVELKDNRIFKTQKIDGKGIVDSASAWDRAVDTEARILERIASELGANATAKGTINLHTVLEPCGSCMDVIRQFLEKYKYIDIYISWD